MYKITAQTVNAIIQASINTYPNEFIGMLGGNKNEKLIDELIIVPAVFGKNFSSIHSHLLPFDSKMLGSIHSHPSHTSQPSNQDLHAFSKLGEVHIIIANPYNVYSMSCYNSKGQNQKLKIIE